MNVKAKPAERRPADFGRQLRALVIPITIQNLISAGAGAADVFMLSFVNQTAIAGVSLASQLVFVHRSGCWRRLGGTIKKHLNVSGGFRAVQMWVREEWE
jgi:hypothetical protein